MSHPLEHEVRSIRRQARRLVVLHAVLSLTAVGLAFALAAGLADYLFRFQDTGLRVMASGGVVAVVTWAVLHFVVPAVGCRWGDVQVAQLIERRFPELSDRLSNAIAFLTQAEGHSAVGSPALREATVQETARAVADLRLRDCLDAWPPVRVALVLLLVVAILAGLCAVDPAASALAARRLLWPFGSEVWPRRNTLVFSKQPTRLAIGDDFEAELIDTRGHLPERVVLEYRFKGDPLEPVQTKAMKPWGDKMVCRLEDVSRSFAYRAVGGDDLAMEWITLEVVEPPRLVAMQVRLEPPAYTHLPAEESGRHIRAWEGTRVRISGRFDKPLRSLTLWSETPEGRESFEAQLAANGLEFSVPAESDRAWFLQTSGSYWFAFLDREDYRAAEVQRSEIHVQRDAPPTVSIAAPTADTYFTTHAIVPLRVVAKDDLAIRSVELEFDGSRRDLYHAPGDAPPDPRGEEQLAAERGTSRTIDYSWDLGSIVGIQPGDTLEFQVVAGDFKPQAGQAATMRVTIISSQELEARIDQRQAAIAEQLREALRLQTTARSQTMSLQIQLQDAGALAQDDVDYLQSAELNQRQVRALLDGEVGGAAERIRALLDELRSNRIHRPQVADRLQGLRREIEEISQDVLPVAQSELTRALKAARADTRRTQEGHSGEQPARPQETDTALTSLSAAGTAQDEAMGRLEALIGQLTQWEGYRQLAQEATQLYREQEEIVRQTTSLPTAAQAVRSLSPPDRANLKRLAQRQNELAREFDRLQTGLGKSREELSASDPSTSAMIAHAVAAARRLAIGGIMREAAGHIDANRIGQARQLHDEVLRGLRELLDQLDRRRGQESLSRLRQVVGRMLQQQRELLSDTRTLQRQRSADPQQLSHGQRTALQHLADRQHNLALEPERFAEAPDLPRAFRFALQRAGRPMQQAAEWLRAGRTDPRVEQAQGEAVRRLQTLVALLDTRPEPSSDPSPPGPPRSPRSDKAPTSMAEVQLLRALQLEINQRTRDLDKSFSGAKPPRNAGPAEFRELADDQGHLASLIEEMLPSESPPPAGGASGETSQRDLDKLLGEAGIPGFSQPPRQTPIPPAPGAVNGGASVPAGDDVGDPASDGDILLRIGRQMRSSEQLLRDANTSRQTQQIQAQILADLNEWIESYQQTSSGQDSESRPGEDDGPAPGTTPGAKPSPIAGDAGPDATPGNPPAQDSQQELLIKVWGQLPQQLQEQIQSPVHEQFLPQYEHIIVEYYKRLAEAEGR